MFKQIEKYHDDYLDFADIKDGTKKADNIDQNK